MRWMKWTLMASVTLLPAFAFADEPAAKNKKPDESPKIGLRIEVQSDGDKPHVFVLGDGDSKESKQAAKEAQEMVKKLSDLIGARNKQNPLGGVATFTARFDRREGEHAPLQYRARLMHEGKKGAFLGISTSTPPHVLSKHIGLQEGFGLVIDSVVPDSPAAKAGVTEFDVLTKIDDQLVINREQLAVLIRAHKPGDEVKLGIIHEGKPVGVSAKLIEHELMALDESNENILIEGALRRLLPAQGTAQWQFAPGQPRGGFAPGQGAQLRPGQSLPGAAINRPVPNNAGKPNPAPATILVPLEPKKKTERVPEEKK